MTIGGSVVFGDIFEPLGNAGKEIRGLRYKARWETSQTNA
jgi:hypothetical protein